MLSSITSLLNYEHKALANTTNVLSNHQIWRKSVLTFLGRREMCK